jgi:dCMP deaminase
MLGLPKKIEDILVEYAFAHKYVDRPEWDDFYLLQACIVSERSHDVQTKCGCVIVSENNVLVSQGYNGFPRNIDDTCLPNTRPLKYPWMIHAEANAILNCKEIPPNSTAYVTGPPCQNCLIMMWQKDIKNIVYTNYSMAHMTEKDSETDDLRTIMKWATDGRLNIRYVPMIDLHFEHLDRVYQKIQSVLGV